MFFFSLDCSSCPNVAHLFCTLNYGSQMLIVPYCYVFYFTDFETLLACDGVVQFLLIDQVEGSDSCVHNAATTKHCLVSLTWMGPKLLHQNAVKVRGQGLYLLSWKTRWARVYLRITCTINVASKKNAVHECFIALYLGTWWRKSWLWASFTRKDTVAEMGFNLCVFS
jgi:hypothetical protein